MKKLPSYNARKGVVMSQTAQMVQRLPMKTIKEEEEEKEISKSVDKSSETESSFPSLLEIIPTYKQ